MALNGGICIYVSFEIWGFGYDGTDRASVLNKWQWSVRAASRLSVEDVIAKTCCSGQKYEQFLQWKSLSSLLSSIYDFGLGQLFSAFKKKSVTIAFVILGTQLMNDQGNDAGDFDKEVFKVFFED